METSLQLFNNLLSNYKLIGKESLTMVEIDNLLSQVNGLVNSSKDFATKEQRDTFNEIMSKITGTKKSGDYPDSVFHMIGDKIYMEQDSKTSIFYIRYNEFWEVFEMKFKLNYHEISDLFRGLLEEHLKCKVNTTAMLQEKCPVRLEEHLKCKVNTTSRLLNDDANCLKNT